MNAQRSERFMEIVNRIKAEFGTDRIAQQSPRQSAEQSETEHNTETHDKKYD